MEAGGGCAEGAVHADGGFAGDTGWSMVGKQVGELVGAERLAAGEEFAESSRAQLGGFEHASASGGRMGPVAKDGAGRHLDLPHRRGDKCVRVE